MLSPICCVVSILMIIGFANMNKEKEQIMATLGKQQKYHCYYCQSDIDRDAKICQKCHKEIPHCTVCSLPILQKDFIGKCVHCGKFAHLIHLQEWLKVKGYCPSCDMKLSERDIIIEGYEKDT